MPTPPPLSTPTLGSSGLTPQAPRPPAELGAPPVDRGLPLPERYDGQRVRVMVASPNAVHAYWELDAAAEGAAGWFLSAEVSGETVHAFGVDHVEGGGRVQQAWLNVPSGATGQVVLSAVKPSGARRVVATLPFATPPDAPRDFADGGGERWVVDAASGEGFVEAPAPSGTRPFTEAPAPRTSGIYGTSSAVALGRRTP